MRKSYRRPEERFQYSSLQITLVAIGIVLIVALVVGAMIYNAVPPIKTSEPRSATTRVMPKISVITPSVITPMDEVKVEYKVVAGIGE